MIKKSVFEQELIAGMQHQLRKQASADQPELVRAGECLHAAMEILEEAGLQKRADQVLRVLYKIGGDSTKHVQKMPTLEKLLGAGLTTADMQAFSKGEQGAKVKMNAVLHRMGFNEHEIAQFIGKHNVVPVDEIATYEKFMGWIKDPLDDSAGKGSAPVMPGQTVSMESLPLLPEDDKDGAPGEEFTFQSIADAKRKKKHDDASVPHNGHTKNLTPQRMIENLKHHGTVFNMADDGGGLDVSNADFDPEFAEALHTDDDLQVEDVLDVDIGQPGTFEKEWKAWKAMRGDPMDDVSDDIPPPPDTVRAIPTPKPPAAAPEIKGPDDWQDVPGGRANMKYVKDVKQDPFDGFDDEIGLEDITDADDDTLYVTDQEPLEDFEDEVPSLK
jgi:hypothetical protein